MVSINTKIITYSWVVNAITKIYDNDCIKVETKLKMYYYKVLTLYIIGYKTFVDCDNLNMHTKVTTIMTKQKNS